MNKYDTIIVGGGIAGLTSAAFLARAGKKILLIEKNNEFGGLVNSFTRDGFHFEAGVRALESAGIIIPMLENLGIQLDFVRSKVSVGVENKILNIEDLNSAEEYRKLLTDIYPENCNLNFHIMIPSSIIYWRLQFHVNCWFHPATYDIGHFHEHSLLIPNHIQNCSLTYSLP